jgi:4-amino-4-deoxy-L-arabinose transferase-like glycosyltransferase
MTGGTASQTAGIAARLRRRASSGREGPATGLPPARPALLPTEGWARLALLLLLFFTLFRGLLFANLVPAFWGPDEDYHFLYADHLVTQHALPDPDTPLYPVEYSVLADSIRYHDYGGGPRTVFKGDPKRSLDTVAALPDSDRDPTQIGRGVGVVHPPGYHSVAAVADWIAGDAPMQTRLTWVRAVTTLFGALVVYAAWLLAAQVFRRAGLALMVGLMVSVQPMIAFLAGVANHDSMLIAFFTLSLALMLFALRTPPRAAQGAWLGGAMTGALAAKGSALALLPLAALAYAGQAITWPERRKEVLRAALVAFGIVLVLAAWWYVRARFAYGTATGAVSTEGSGTGGASVADTASVGLSQLVNWAKEWTGLTYRTYWWHFLYWDAPAHTVEYYVPAFVGVIGMLGVGGAAWAARRELRSPGRPLLRQILLMVTAALAVLLPFLVIDLSRRANGQGFYVNGGRYLLPAFAAVVTLFLVGVLHLIRRTVRPLVLGAVALLAVAFGFQVFRDQYLHRYFGEEGFGELLRRISFDRPAFITPATLWILLALVVLSFAVFAFVLVRGAWREREPEPVDAVR